MISAGTERFLIIREIVQSKGRHDQSLSLSPQPFMCGKRVPFVQASTIAVNSDSSVPPARAGPSRALRHRWSGERHNSIAYYKHSAPLERERS
jgi:hypothetical protein